MVYRTKRESTVFPYYPLFKQTEKYAVETIFVTSSKIYFGDRTRYMFFKNLKYFSGLPFYCLVVCLDLKQSSEETLFVLKIELLAQAPFWKSDSPTCRRWFHFLVEQFFGSLNKNVKIPLMNSVKDKQVWCEI